MLMENNEVSGYIYFDTYLSLTEVKFNMFNESITDKSIRFDTFISEFDVDARSLADLYTRRQHDAEKYVEAVAGQLEEICASLFDVKRSIYNSDDEKYDVMVFKDGRVWVKRSMRLYVVGENPKMSTLELREEIEKQTKEYLKGAVAGILPECTYSYIVPGIN